MNAIWHSLVTVGLREPVCSSGQAVVWRYRRVSPVWLLFRLSFSQSSTVVTVHGHRMVVTLLPHNQWSRLKRLTPVPIWICLTVTVRGHGMIVTLLPHNQWSIKKRFTSVPIWICRIVTVQYECDFAAHYQWSIKKIKKRLTPVPIWMQNLILVGPDSVALGIVHTSPRYLLLL